MPARPSERLLVLESNRFGTFLGLPTVASLFMLFMYE